MGHLQPLSDVCTCMAMFRERVVVQELQFFIFEGFLYVCLLERCLHFKGWCFNGADVPY